MTQRIRKAGHKLDDYQVWSSSKSATKHRQGQFSNSIILRTHAQEGFPRTGDHSSPNGRNDSTNLEETSSAGCCSILCVCRRNLGWEDNYATSWLLMLLKKNCSFSLANAELPLQEAQHGTGRLWLDGQEEQKNNQIDTTTAILNLALLSWTSSSVWLVLNTQRRNIKTWFDQF